MCVVLDLSLFLCLFSRGQKETADAGVEWESILFWTALARLRPLSLLCFY